MARRPHTILCCILWAASLTKLAPAGASEADYAWPLESRPRGITGTFMEPRSRHYHSGLDIKTEGRTGLRVLAPAPGWVSRLRVSPEGYGKAVYLRLADGKTLVFAHLSHFADSLQQEVTRAQSRAGVYEQDLRFERGQLAFEIGDLLALSGATGTGAPHLHLEVRDAAQRPQNPLTHGFAVPDREAPQVRQFRLVALDAAARIHGLAETLAFEPEATVSAVGALGLQIELLDTTGVFRHTLMPLGLEVIVEGESVYRLEQQSFDFAQGRQMRLEIVPDEEPGRRWVRAYRHAANDLPDRTPARASFDLDPDGERRRVDLRVWDAAGNESRSGFWLVGAGPPVVTRAPRTRPRVDFATGWSLQVDPQENVLQVRAAGPVDEPAGYAAVAIEIDGPGRARPLRPAWSAGDRGLCAAVEYGLLENGSSTVRLIERGTTRVLAESSLDLVLGGTRFDWIPVADGRLALDDFDGGGLFAGGAVWGEAIDRWPDLPPGTRRVMGPWRIRATAAFEDGVGVAVRLPDGTDLAGLGLFLQDPKGSWSLLGGEIVESVDGEGRPVVYLRGELDGTGALAVLADPHPPYLGGFFAGGRKLDGVLPVLHPRTSRAKNGVTLPRWPTLALPLVDAGAGLSAAGIVAELDGQPFPARWDPEEERLYFDFHEDPGQGVHRARVRVTDDLGNSRESTLQFELRDF